MDLGVDNSIIGSHDPILVTGAAGFIGRKVVQILLEAGFERIRCLVRSSNKASELLHAIGEGHNPSRLEILQGNLLSREVCANAAESAAVVFHLAAARGEKSFADAFLNSVVTTRNLLDATLSQRCLRRFVNVSSFSVYSNEQNTPEEVLDESCAIETLPALRGEAYCFAKSKQEEIVREYGEKFRIPYVIVRPGHVYGAGNEGITGRVGVGTFGIFLHLGGSNLLPLTYVDNCAEAIVLAGIRRLERSAEVFNVVDDDLPCSRDFLRQYKRHVKSFRSFYVPHALSYALCGLWEWYSKWSQAQIEPVFNRKRWSATWKKTNYSNEKLKRELGWKPRISTDDGLRAYFASCRHGGQHA